MEWLTDTSNRSRFNWSSFARTLAGLSIFALAYLIINYTQILYKVYYRWAAAGDADNAILNMSSFSVQAVLLLAACIVSSRNVAIAGATIMAGSAIVHQSYEQILGGYIEADSMTWLLSEARQIGPAMREFLLSFLIAGSKVAIAFILMVVARRLLRSVFLIRKSNSAGYTKALFAGIVLMVAPGEVLRSMGLPQGNETSAYTMAAHSLFESHPLRAQVEVNPVDNEYVVNKIVWLIDESCSAKGVELAISSSLKVHEPIDFKEVSSMGNCSASSNAALRWGVDVQNISTKTDPRTTPSIWAYAKHAGYRTTLIDGQVSGAPQNMIWQPERAMVDDFFPRKGGIDTDHSIAEQVNQMLQRPGRDFIFVVLRGAHYSYESNYPEGWILDSSSLLEKYLGAIRYSKLGFFDTLFRNVNRENVAVFYTSDHGQHLAAGIVPHCTRVPTSDEFSVPLLAFFPIGLVSNLNLSRSPSSLSGRSHSQIFPTSIYLMGYDRKHAESKYDALLDLPTKKYVWFGRSLTPSAATGSIELHTSARFPMR